MTIPTQSVNAWVELHGVVAQAIGEDAARQIMQRAWAMTRLTPCDPSPEPVAALLLALEVVGQDQVLPAVQDFRSRMGLDQTFR